VDVNPVIIITCGSLPSTTDIDDGMQVPDNRDSATD